MAVPMTADQFVKVLRAEGLSVKEHPGWRTNNRNHKGEFDNVNGVVIHHTAGSDSLGFVFRGTPALPGPLCHTHLSKSGTATMVGNGRANHAGTFAANAHNAVVAESSKHPSPSRSEPVDGNRHYYGIEIENLGDGRDFYPEAQYRAAVLWAAAICRHHKWSADSVIGHKEGTLRKIDPKGPIGSAKGEQWDMNEFRKDVAAQLKRKPGKAPAPSKPPKPKAPPFPGRQHFKAGANNTHVTQLGKQLVKRGYGRYYAVGPGPRWSAADRNAVRAFQKAQKWAGADADGYPGPATWKRLFN
ncbi:peptidoglycan-binding protein [Streptomyces sp. CS7]|uniref:peptidoglycan-binding protein n=1 Tax=Streptomyces TaxID=1883 RepID=UPI0021B32B95|nr:peptidoglycan-binding protein [Streptomyces sp. CS-7]MCT6776098.1 peptidoglycan-binding protein [Streptomyces sp. CS-7]